MSARKSERLMNLLILLLVSRSYLTKEQIREGMEDYRDSGRESFEKMFERDKEELRSLGVPIEMGSHDPLFEDDAGYRIKRDAFELPEIDFTADEAAMVGVAARVWQHAGLADTTSQALLKLTAGGADVDRAGIQIAQPALSADEPGFDAIFSATTQRRPVSFGYRRSGTAEVTQRHLQPWGLVQAHGRWYVVGQDTDREAPRVFRLSRIDGAVTISGRGPAYEVPEGTDIRALARSLDPSADADEPRTAVLWLRPGSAADLRRRASGEPRAGSLGGVEGETISVEFTDRAALLADVIGHGDAAVILEPADLRAAAVERLSAVVEDQA